MDSKDRPEPIASALPVRRTLTHPALVDPASLPAHAEVAGSIDVGRVMLRVLARHWGKILVIWAVLSAGLVLAIQVRVKPIYETFSLLRVEPANNDLFSVGMNAAEVHDLFLQTQVQLISSPSVLSAALSDPRISKTSVLEKARDPESELRSLLQVFVVPKTYLIQVSMASSRPDEAARIINAVVESYHNVAAGWSNEKNKIQLKSLEDYKSDLTEQIHMQEQTWLALAGNSDIVLVDPPPSSRGSTLPSAKPSQVSIDDYKRARDQLFAITLDLIEAESLLKHRQAELEVRTSGVDPVLLREKRIDEVLRNDSEIASLQLQIEKARQTLDHVKRVARSASDPALLNARQRLLSLQKQLGSLWDRKRTDLAARPHENLGGEDQSLVELKAQIENMKIRKSYYEQHVNNMQVKNQQQSTDAVKVALIREDLSSLRAMKDSVQKRIEQLRFDSRSEARIKTIDRAKEFGTLKGDSRRKLYAMTPVGVIAMVLGLFLLLEIRNGRVADLEEVSRRVPVEVYPVPSLPATRRTSDQRILRTNEGQLQEFLQSLDHLRVSLWFGKEAAGGSSRCLAITSAIAGEGKTTLSAHLAVCCAKAGISTLVIDADLRRAALSRMFEEERSLGFSDVLKGELAPEDAVIALRDGGFHLLPAGTPGQHPGWLFREQRIGQVIERYRQIFDMVILDTPPVLPVADALTLSRWIDGVVLVIRYEMSRFSLVDRARRRIISAGIPILKTVVNGVKTAGYGSNYGYGGDYGYHYGYGERTPPTDLQGTAAP
jgi:capsular exopolysaccharide synthesis family protein